MKQQTHADLQQLMEHYPELKDCKESIAKSFDILYETQKNGGTIFTCGNGGSAADSEHIVGELMKCFKRPRAIDAQLYDHLSALGEDGRALAEKLEGGIRAVALTSHPALSTAYANDRFPDMVFAQQLSVLGRDGDSLIAISTSGNSENCVYAAMVAKAKNIRVIAMTGSKNSKLREIADYCICVPAEETYRIQEYHLPIYHALCAMLESEIYA